MAALIPTTTAWTDHQGRTWTVTIDWNVDTQPATAVGLHLVSDTGEARVDSEVLRKLPTGRLISAAWQRLPAQWTRALFADTEVTADNAPTLWKYIEARADHLFADVPKGRDLGDDHYREVARVYAEAVAARRPPTKAVAEHFTVEASSAAKKVARARERGFLPKTTRGRVGRIEEQS